MRKKQFLRHLPAFVFILLILLMWYFIAENNIVSAYILPSPLKVLCCIIELIKSGEILNDISISILRILKGFSISLLIAFVLGAVSSLVPFIRVFIDDNVSLIKNVPPLCLIPLLILWFGIGETTKVVVIILASFFPLYINIVKGFTSTDRKLIEVGKVFDYSKKDLFLYIVLPNSLRDILSGIKIALGYSWRAIVASEMIASTSGIGHFIVFSQELSRTDRVVAGIIIVAFTGYLVEKIIGIIIDKGLKRNVDYGQN